MPTSRTRARSDWAVSRASLRIFLSWSWAETAAKNEVAREESLLPSSTSVWSSHCLSCKSWFVNLLIESAPGPDKLKLYWDIKASYENFNSRLYFIQIYIVFVKKNHCIRSLWIKKSVPDLVFHVKIFLVESRWDGISICRTEMVREWVVFCGLIFGKRSFLQLLQIILEVVFCHVAQFRRRDGRGGFRVPNWPTGIVQHGFKWATTYSSDIY